MLNPVLELIKLYNIASLQDVESDIDLNLINTDLQAIQD